MTKFLLLGLLTGLSLASGGCNTPAYSADERHAMFLRNWDYEGRQATDDWDTLGMLRPAGHLTIWNVR